MNQILSNKDEYCKRYILNECLFGQSYEQILEMLHEMDTHININFDNCILILSGIEKRFYTSKIHMKRKNYLNINNEVKSYMNRLAQQYHFIYEVICVNYDVSKLIALVISFEQDKIDGLELASKIGGFIQKAFEKQGLTNQMYIKNHTILSEEIHTFDIFQKQFEYMLKQHRLSFFCMDQPIEKVNNYTISEMANIDEKLEGLEEAIFATNPKKLENTLHYLMSQLKETRSVISCYELLSSLKKRLLIMNELYELNLDERILSVLSVSQYCCVEEMEDAIFQLLKCFIPNEVVEHKKISALTLKCLHYLKRHYTENIGLNEVAYHFKVAPAYLSRIFNQDISISMPQYITNLRMEKAKKLLVNSDKKIVEIAESVGYHNAQYFCLQFKKNTQLRPQEYRNMYRQ